MSGDGSKHGSLSHRVGRAVPGDAQVGEGPTWDPRNDRLLWVDIPNGALHVSDPTTGADAATPLAPLLGAVVPRCSGGFAAVTADGFAVVEEGPGPLTPTAAVTPEAHRRMNDGKCDPAGRFWAGSTAYDFTVGQGALHCWTGGESAVTAVGGLSLPNGLGWSPDARTFYLADSVPRHIYAFGYDVESGRLGDRRLLCAFTPDEGVPDGLAVDAEGCLWVSMWGGGHVCRVDPRGRSVLRVPTPVSQPASCAFGPGTVLYVTTARAGLSAGNLAREPWAGSVLAVDVGVEGVPVDACAC